MLTTETHPEVSDVALEALTRATLELYVCGGPVGSAPDSWHEWFDSVKDVYLARAREVLGIAGEPVRGDVPEDEARPAVVGIVGEDRRPLTRRVIGRPARLYECPECQYRARIIRDVAPDSEPVPCPKCETGMEMADQVEEREP